MPEQIAAAMARQFGDRPRPAWRHAHGWTQDQVAARFNEVVGDEKASMTGNRISDYEKWPAGGVKPKPDTLRILAMIYKTTPAKLVDRNDRRGFDPKELISIESSPAPAAHSRVHQHGGKAGFIAPRQLPAPPRLFIGRARELAALTAALAMTDSHVAAILAVGGAGGIGKTWLALHWAHQNLHRFPDGHLYMNLKGFDPSGQPMPWSTAVRTFLDALGVDPASIPADPDAQVAQYRRLVSGQHMLILLDNARDSMQVIPLLPQSATCTVLITSRHRLAGLVTGHCAHLLDLDILPDVEARDLLECYLGPARLAVEPDAVDELLDFCAGLPLALSIVAARAVIYPNFPLAVFADELRDRSVRLTAFDAGDLNANLTAVLSWSYHALDRQAATVFALLGKAPGPDVSLLAAASLAALPPARTLAVLQDLESSYLVHQHMPRRYRMHDHIRLYATRQASHDIAVDTRNAALRRLVDFYLHTAYVGERMLDPHRTPVKLERTSAGCQPYSPSDVAEALAWFDAEYPCLFATQQFVQSQGWHNSVWQMACATDTFHHRRGHLHDNLATWRAALVAADQSADSTIQILARRRLGWACARVGRLAEALDHLQQALILATDTGDLCNQARTHYGLSWTWGRQENPEMALEHATHALDIFHTLEDSVWEALALNLVGWFSARLGYYDEAHARLEASFALCRRDRCLEGEAVALDSLGYLANLTGEHAQALDYYHQALALYNGLGDVYSEANTLDCLAQSYAALGRYGHARRAWQHAVELYETQHRTNDAERVLQQLNALDGQ
ncbi:MAG: tetratricopeptide repeat protein [Pseudonocardiales bacterium]